jgi:dihydrofolate reductase
MGRLVVFNLISLDGYFVDAKGDMSWAHNPAPDPEWDAFVEGNARGGGTLVFGRITYELMASYWPTPEASRNDPGVAERMNSLPKIVFSRTLDRAPWSNTRLVKEGMADEIRRLKRDPANDLAIMGSGSVVSQLAELGLVDEYQIVVTPVVLGAGRTMFEGLAKRQSLKLTMTRSFVNGNVLVCYQPTA